MTREIYKEWLKEAKNDFRAGKTLYKAKIFNTAVFHFQQSVEKVLKAALYFYNEQPWGHSILKLIQHLQKIGKDEYSSILSEGREFDLHYTSTRYPDTLPDISPSELYDRKISQKLMKNAEKILDFVQEEMEKSKLGGQGEEN